MPGEAPLKTILARDAANLIAVHDAMAAARRNRGLQLAALAKAFIIDLARARDETRSFRTTGPTQFLGRGLTLLVRRNHGHWEAFLGPNQLPEETASRMLDDGDAGMFHRPEDWGDTRYYDSFQAAFCHPRRWGDGCGAKGLVALAAQASHEQSRALRQRLATALQEAEAGFGAEELLDAIRHAARKASVPSREATLIPVRILRVARMKGLGFGETLAFWLYADVWGPGITAKETTYILDVSTTDQVKKMARTARRKLDGLDTLMRLVPPWPADTSKSSAEDGETRTRRNGPGGET